jgi:enoyl-CoA hydratase/carnithine racemase
MADMLLEERGDRVAWLTVNRPEVRNALSLELCALMTARLTALGRDRDVRVVVLRGAGEKVFISGADVREFREKLATPEAALEYDEVAERLSVAIEHMPQPVIAMIHGYAVGSGCTVAMACDLRLAGAQAKFGIPIARFGLLASVPDTARLVALVGAARAKWLLLSGQLIGAEEAQASGLVHRVVDAAQLEATTREVAGLLAANAPLTLKSAKQIVDLCAGPRGRTIRDGAPWYEEIFRSRDLQEGIDAFFAKRKPVFAGE